MTEVTIRKAAFEDAQNIADFHVKVWRDTYQTLAPADAYRVLNEKYRGAIWREKLHSHDGDQIVLIAAREGVIVGIGAAGQSSEPLFGGRGEIKFLYVDPDLQGRGIGRALLSQLATHLRDREYSGAALGVVKGNQSALALYEHLGGRRGGEYTDPGPIWRSHNIVFLWDDLNTLTARNSGGITSDFLNI